MRKILIIIVSIFVVQNIWTESWTQDKRDYFWAPHELLPPAYLTIYDYNFYTYWRLGGSTFILGDWDSTGDTITLRPLYEMDNYGKGDSRMRSIKEMSDKDKGGYCYYEQKYIISQTALKPVSLYDKIDKQDYSKHIFTVYYEPKPQPGDTVKLFCGQL